jgi:hypothetical protein
MLPDLIVTYIWRKEVCIHCRTTSLELNDAVNETEALAKTIPTKTNDDNAEVDFQNEAEALLNREPEGSPFYAFTPLDEARGHQLRKPGSP